MPQTINLEEIWKEARSDSKAIERWLNTLETPSCTKGVFNMLGQLVSDNPTLVVFFNQRQVIGLFKAMMAFAFEAGRLYGRIEIARETEPKV